MLFAHRLVTPLVLEGTPRFRTSYVNFGYVDPVLRGVGLLPDRFIYHNWPLFPVAMAALVRVTGISPLLLMAVFPLVMILALLVPLAAILRTIAIHGTTTGDDTGRAHTIGRVAWPAGLWLFVLQLDEPGLLQPQALAYLLFVTWLAVLIHVVVRRAGELTMTTTIALLALFSLIVVTHVLTSLEVLGVLAVLTAARLLRRPTLIVTCGLIFFAWQLNVAGPFFAFYADRLQNSLLDITDFVQVNLASRVTGSPQHAQIAELRILVTGLLLPWPESRSSCVCSGVGGRAAWCSGSLSSSASPSSPQPRYTAERCSSASCSSASRWWPALRWRRSPPADTGCCSSRSSW